MFFKRAQKSQYIWATFGRNIVAKNFQNAQSGHTVSGKT